jgi:SNF2 family DNA or RNA helicase
VQRLKSLSSKLLGKLSVFRTDHRVLMSGTPLQNNTTVRCARPACGAAVH